MTHAPTLPTGSAARSRAWSGPALLSYGFRPFFLGAGIWAVVAMALWSATLAGGFGMTTAFDPVSWHAHEFLFGYLGAVIAGFLLTATPNWTGRLPIVGWPLLGLALLWSAGRVTVLVSGGASPLLVAAVDLAFPAALGAAMAREIVAGRNWRNLIVLAMLVAFTVGNAVFHLEAAQGGYAAGGLGLRIGLGAAILMIAVIGGRIVPSFTRNWLVRRRPGRLPAAPMRPFDRAALLVLVAATLLWAARPDADVAGWALLAAGGLHAVRLGRWAGERTLAEPLVAVLHVAYAFVPLGAVALGAAILWPRAIGAAAAQHLWMGGAIGLMTLAVMTRATLGHTGRPLKAGPATTAIYAALVAAVLARVAAGAWPEAAATLHGVAGAGWILAFGGFVARYGPMLARPSAAKAG